MPITKYWIINRPDRGHILQKHGNGWEGWKVKRILLACSSGMSTSLLVSRMKEAAAARGVDVDIWAVSQDKAATEMRKADVLLVGPQMRFLIKKLSQEGAAMGIPIEAIDPIAYGRVDGEAVLEKALELIKRERNPHESE